MKDKDKTSLILNSLKNYYTSYGRERSNIIFPELRLGSGYCGVAQRRIDLFLISSGAGNETTAFEIKVSKQDFKNDLQKPLKQRGARLYANKFYYVTPKGLLDIQDIPLWAGLLELDLTDDYCVQQGYFKEVVPAPLHSKAMPSWGLICSIVRHLNKDLGQTEIENLQKQIKIQNNTITHQDNLLRALINNKPYMEYSIQPYKE